MNKTINDQMQPQNSKICEGNGGTPNSIILPGYKLICVKGRGCNRIDGLQFFFSNGVQMKSSDYYGGQGGQSFCYSCANDDYITDVEITSGDRVNSLKFTTNKNLTSQTFGGNGGEFKTRDTYKIQSNGIIGVNIRSGTQIDSIQFILN